MTNIEIGFIIAKVVAGVAYMGLEYWLGKTDKTQAGSVLQLIAQKAVAVLKKVE